MAKRPEPMYGRPFYFQRWLDGHRGLLEPPVGNAQLQEESGLMVTVVGGPDQRTDFHDDPIEEFFHQIRGSMVLRIMEEEGRPPRGVRFYGGDRRCPHCGAVRAGSGRPGCAPARAPPPDTCGPTPASRRAGPDGQPGPPNPADATRSAS